MTFILVQWFARYSVHDYLPWLLQYYALLKTPCKKCSDYKFDYRIKYWSCWFHGSITFPEMTERFTTSIFKITLFIQKLDLIHWSHSNSMTICQNVCCNNKIRVNRYKHYSIIVWHFWTLYETQIIWLKKSLNRNVKQKSALKNN